MKAVKSNVGLLFLMSAMLGYAAETPNIVLMYADDGGFLTFSGVSSWC